MNYFTTTPNTRSSCLMYNKLLTENKLSPISFSLSLNDAQNQRNPAKYRELIQQVILYMTKGIDMTPLFATIVKVRTWQGCIFLLLNMLPWQLVVVTITTRHHLLLGLQFCFGPRRTWWFAVVQYLSLPFCYRYPKIVT